MIAGFETATSGAVRIRDREMSGVPPYDRNAGMVFQGYALFPHKTVGENVGFGLKMEGVPKEEREKKVKETLELVDLPGLEDRSPNELSGGQQQRVALARALAIEPSLLLLDEPLSNLDYKLRRELRFQLKRIQEEVGVTTIYVTHNQEEAMAMSDRILILNDGQREQLGTPEEIYNKPKTRFVADFIGEANLFDGTVTQYQNGNAEIELSTETNRSLTVPANGAVEEGQPVTINVRPERITATDDEGMLTGEIVSRTYLGKSTRLLVSVDGSEVEAEIPSDQLAGISHDLSIGTTVNLAWQPEACVIVGEVN
ncbi:spermidine/putrescine ABC transporter ATPase [Natronorubrum bangense JCM 10635]|nr:spermidine/putrescine ABC transporter ATPase [Natronorubrum bangense JCM 10635]